MQKFRAYNSKTIADGYAIAQQFQAKIEELVAANEGSNVSDLPASVVPTDTLYLLLLCYDVMYNTLCAEHLIKDGHIKPSGVIH